MMLLFVLVGNIARPDMRAAVDDDLGGGVEGGEVDGGSTTEVRGRATSARDGCCFCC